MSQEHNNLKSLIVSLFNVGGLKFGSYTLKSGIVSPVYFDLRVIIAHPQILDTVCSLVGEELKNVKTDLICGVPYTALPVASILSVKEGIPMVIKRKEQKTYGTGKLIEGCFNPGDKCLIIEDVVTSGSSIMETAEALRAQGIVVTDAIVILERGQGAGNNLQKNGIRIHPLITVDKMLIILEGEGLITPNQGKEVGTFIKENQFFDPILDSIFDEKLIPSIECPVGKRLVQIMKRKRSNLCLSADLDKWEDVLEAVEAVGSHVCMVKTHVDIIGLKGGRIIAEFWQKLKALSIKYDFLIMEDHKFADIGSTVQKQLTSKPFEISKWVDLVTMHGISGSGVLTAVQQLGLDDKLGVVMIAEMSSEGNIPTQLPGYKDLIYEMGSINPSIVVGFVSQSQNQTQQSESPYFLQFTPGVSLDSSTSGDGLGQQYNTVENAVLKRGADVIIVGRGILKAGKQGWASTAEQFRSKGWKAFRERVCNEL